MNIGACYFKFFSHADTTDNLEMKLECEPPEVKIERDGHADHVDISLYEYPFENIVFGGGGAKGLAYCGVIQVGQNYNVTTVLVLSKLKK